MIPNIEDILRALASGDMSLEVATRYINTHLELADERAALQNLCSVCGRPPHANDDPACVPASPDYGPLIALGHGQVEVGEGIADGLPALIFGRNGTGTLGEATEPTRAHEPGETIVSVTFANVESLDVVVAVLARLRARMAGAAES